MVVIASVALLLLAAAAMMVLRLLRPSFGYYWLIAAGAGFLSWGLVIVLGFMLPVELQLTTWDFAGFSSSSIYLLADKISWPFGVGLLTVLLATILTDVVRAVDIEWSNWASCLLISGLALIAVYSATLLTFFLIWTAVDIIGFILLVMQETRSEARRRLVMRLAAQLIGTLCLVLAGLLSPTGPTNPTFDATLSPAVALLVMAAALRLGSLPESEPIIEKDVHRRSFGTLVRLSYSGMIFVFLVRTGLEWAEMGISPSSWVVLTVFLALIGLLSGASWLLARNELSGRQSFLTAVGAIVLVSVLRSQPEAGLAWGIAGLFAGGLIFLASVRTKISLWITIVGVLGLSALPFTPAWNGLEIFSVPVTFSMIFFFLMLILLIWGYLTHAFVEESYPEGIERWIRVVYPVGLIILPITQFSLGWMMRPEINEVAIQGWVIGLIISVLAILGYMRQKRGGRLPEVIAKSMKRIIALGWLSAIFRFIFSLLERFINFITLILEGEGGFLWILLWIVLFLAVLLINIGI